MKKDKIIEYIFIAILYIVLFFDFFVSNIFDNKIIFATFLGIYAILCKIFVKSKKVDSIHKNMVIFLMIFFAILFIGILYFIGIFVGFYKNPAGLSIQGLQNRILPYSAIIIFSEIIRSTFVLRNNKKSTVLITIALVLVEVTAYIQLYHLAILGDALAFVGNICLASISINLLCNYIVKRYGIIPNIAYRLITVIYTYVFSVLPDIYAFFQSAIKMVYPYMIYWIIDSLFASDNFKVALKNKKTSFIGLLISIVVATIVILLISCQFRYGIIVVGSASMTGSVNKGDAVIFEKYVGQELEEGQIILFNKENVKTIHRIQDIQIFNNETVYFTKGDNNQKQDDGYRKNSDVIGVIKFKIGYIGWPTIWINEMFQH